MSVVNLVNESLEMYNKWNKSYKESEPAENSGKVALTVGDSSNFSQEGRAVTHSGQVALERGGSPDFADEGKPTDKYTGKTVLSESSNRIERLTVEGGAFGRLVLESIFEPAE
jgi:hypothetical protein